MSSRDWQRRVRDILGAIQIIQERLRGVSYEDFAANELLIESVLYQLMIIGEAAANIPAEVKTDTPTVPWREMNDMRNLIAHEYFRVNVQIVWGTAQNNLPPLVAPLNRLLAQ